MYPFLHMFNFLAYWAAAPKGPMTYAFTHRGNFSFFFSFFFFFSSVHPLEPQIQS